jgi:uncharacterized protein
MILRENAMTEGYSMCGETNLPKLISSMRPALCDECFVFITATASMNNLVRLESWALISEDEGTTLIIDKGKADSNDLPYQGVFKRITLTVHSSLEAVGLTAAVSTKLAEHGISANVVAAFFHDHIFVPEGKAGQAMDALEELVREKTAF